MDPQTRPKSFDDLVSYNLGEARKLRGWTQQEAAEKLSEYLGRSWSVQVYGDAERAHRSSRVKVFSGDELIAMSRAFELPLTWWFLPESPNVRLAPRGTASDDVVTGADLLDYITPVSGGMSKDFRDRLTQLFDASPELRDKYLRATSATEDLAARAARKAEIEAVAMEAVRRYADRYPEDEEDPGIRLD
ncbi:helix-turn-helix transcriptional regulator [Lentzea sp. NPDC005914]|uniref:helix-turn-helix domain-containing protein n=1 Tax=Lentzea sp. NPDC005914 TaxID=3154572 RepID=UPI003404ECF7